MARAVAKGYGLGGGGCRRSNCRVTLVEFAEFFKNFVNFMPHCVHVATIDESLFNVQIYTIRIVHTRNYLLIYCSLKNKDVDETKSYIARGILAKGILVRS